MRGDLPGFVNDALRRQRQGPTAHDCTAAGEGADALLDRQRIAVSNGYVLHGHVQLVGHHLREDGLMSLTVGTGTGEHRDLTGALHAYRGAFKANPATRLDKRRDARTD